MKLIDSKTRKPLTIGQEVTTSRGENFVLAFWREPHKPSSEGFVYLEPVYKSDSECVSQYQYYASVIGAEFYPRTDRS